MVPVRTTSTTSTLEKTMATVMLMHWPEVSREQYEHARREINWEGNVPQGAKFHVAWFGDDGFHVLDLWESAEEFQRFTEERLMPGVQKIGIQGQPRVEFAEAHAVFAPNV
jgi:hypothetical protein